ncbi:zinc-binding dehydrogenase [Tichowtungia aerotolerans]|uniref:Zinc-binding dehydrogenase n=1 Tax=Tichowtungia aerotolerans TaxID=2697043 RepID=A0A6P1M7W1_9BACT|nr:zinc-binding dehydrogenase [Tichowtungia aerotolerans]QHI69961.1 zinc-binding dehydrogenase [Tichowtungia aerotolerans]
MKTKAVRLYGESDLRLEEFELPAIKETEILAKIVSDSICMSSYKAATQGTKHKRIPNNVADEPIIIGHEFCGEIVEVGAKWADKFKAGDKFSIQPALVDENGPVGVLSAPGYSYNYIGGDAQYVIIPEEVMTNDCLLAYNGDAFYLGSLAEPMSCIVGGYHANYHTTPGSYVHKMEIVEGGSCAILAGVGPMGLGAIDYAIHADRKPSLVVVTDIDTARLERAASIFTVEEAKANGVELIYVNTAEEGKGPEYLKSLTPGGKGFDDVFVYAPVAPVVEQADAILGFDGCLNFFAGPTNPEFAAKFNFYNVHYAATHVVGTSGGNTDDMRESLAMMEAGKLNPSVMITHVGGLDAVIETTLNLPKIPGGKKLVYTGISMPLTALEELKDKDDDLSKGLAEIVERHNGLWSPEAEKYLLANAPAI